MSKRWEGHASDTEMVQERAQALRATWRGAPRPRSVVADATRSQAANAPSLAQRGFRTRLPGPRTLVTQGSPHARRGDPGPYRAALTRSQRLALGHAGMAQRWRVGWSPASLERAEARVNNAGQRAAEAIQQPLFPLPAQRCATPTPAHKALAALAQQGRYPQGASSALLAHKRSGHKGRPTAETPRRALEWPRHAQGRRAAERLEDAHQPPACLVLGPNIETAQRSEAEVSAGSKAPSPAEGGCRWLQAPVFLVASLLVKNPRRMQGLWMVMPLALLVSAVAQRRLRRACARQNATMPHHSNQPTSHPTLRWVVHMLAGLARVRVTVDGRGRDLRTGWHEVKSKILHLFGEQVCHV